MGSSPRNVMKIMYAMNRYANITLSHLMEQPISFLRLPGSGRYRSHGSLLERSNDTDLLCQHRPLGADHVEDDCENKEPYHDVRTLRPYEKEHGATTPLG